MFSYTNFFDYQMNTVNTDGKDSAYDLLDPTQKMLMNFIGKFNMLCNELDMKFNGMQTDGLNMMQNDTADLKVDMVDMKEWSNYVAEVSKKVLNIEEKRNYSYYQLPVKDEFGSVRDGAWDTPNMYTPPLTDDDELLRIDKHGSIWINGVIETSTIKIGDAIKRMAEQYKEDIPINNIEQLNL